MAAGCDLQRFHMIITAKMEDMCNFVKRSSCEHSCRYDTITEFRDISVDGYWQLHLVCHCLCDIIGTAEVAVPTN